MTDWQNEKPRDCGEDSISYSEVEPSAGISLAEETANGLTFSKVSAADAKVSLWPFCFFVQAADRHLLWSRNHRADEVGWDDWHWLWMQNLTKESVQTAQEHLIKSALLETQDVVLTGEDFLLASLNMIDSVKALDDAYLWMQGLATDDTTTSETFNIITILAYTGSVLLDNVPTAAPPMGHGGYGEAMYGPPLYNALEFDGADDYVALDKFFDAAGALPELTVEAWVRIDSDETGNWSVLDYDRSEYFTAAFTADGSVNGNGGYPAFHTTASDGSGHDMWGNTDITGTGWRHVAWVYDGVDKIIYIDGAEDARASNPHSGNSLGSGTTRYGFLGDGSEASSFDGSRNNIYFSGAIADVREWSDARTQTEIQDNMNHYLVGDETGLVAYWPALDGLGSVVNDQTQNGNDGTINGARWAYFPMP